MFEYFFLPNNIYIKYILQKKNKNILHYFAKNPEYFLYIEKKKSWQYFGL